MKRTGELVLGIIGSILLLIGILLSVSVNTFIGSDEFNNQLQNDVNNEMQTNPDFNDEDMAIVEELLDATTSFAVGLSVTWIIAGILGIIATIFVRKKAKLSGILFIVGGVIGIFSVIPAILYVIAGIMALVRKAPPTPESPEMI